MFEQCDGNCRGGVVSNGVGEGEVGIMFNNKEDADVTVLIGRGNRDVIDANGAIVVEQGLSAGRIRNRLEWKPVFLSERTFCDHVLDYTKWDAVTWKPFA